MTGSARSWDLTLALALALALAQVMALALAQAQVMALGVPPSVVMRMMSWPRARRAQAMSLSMYEWSAACCETSP